MSRSEEPATQLGWHRSAQEHRGAVQDVIALQESRTLLVQRLERVVVALALTLDAETAAEDRLARLEELAGVSRIINRPSNDWSMLAQRYRDLLAAIGSINDQLRPESTRTSS